MKNIYIYHWQHLNQHLEPGDFGSVSLHFKYAFKKKVHLIIHNTHPGVIVILGIRLIGLF